MLCLNHVLTQPDNTSIWLRKNCNDIFTYQEPELAARYLHPELAVRYLHLDTSSQNLHPELVARYLHPELAVRYLHLDTSSQNLHPELVARTCIQTLASKTCSQILTFRLCNCLVGKCNYFEFGHITVSKLIYVQN